MNLLSCLVVLILTGSNILAVVAIIKSWKTNYAIWLIVLLGINMIMTKALRRTRDQYGSFSEEAKFHAILCLFLQIGLIALSIVSFFR